MKKTFFWFVTPCSTENNRRFGRIYRPHFQRSAGSLIRTPFLNGVLFDHEDGDDILLQNVGLFQTMGRYNPEERPLLIVHCYLNIPVGKNNPI
jgi:hypothetical protein